MLFHNLTLLFLLTEVICTHYLTDDWFLELNVKTRKWADTESESEFELHYKSRHQQKYKSFQNQRIWNLMVKRSRMNHVKTKDLRNWDHLESFYVVSRVTLWCIIGCYMNVIKHWNWARMKLSYPWKMWDLATIPSSFLSIGFLISNFEFFTNLSTDSFA